MVRTIILTIVLLFSTFASSAGNQNQIDSLIRLLNKDLDDSTRYEVLVALCQDSYDFDLSKALEYGDMAYDLALEKGFESKVKFLNLLVYLNDHSGRYQKSILYLEHIIDILSKRNEKDDRISLMNYKGWLSMRREEYSDAIEIFQKGITIAEEAGDVDYVLRFYYNLAKAYERLAMEEEEVNYYNKYLDRVDWDKKNRYVSMIFIRMGDIDRLKGSLAPALEYYFRAMELAEQAGDSSQMVMVLNKIAWNYYKMDELELALDYYHENIKISKQLKSQNYLTNCYGNLGTIYRDWGNYDSSLIYYNKSIDISKEIHDYFNLAWEYKRLRSL